LKLLSFFFSYNQGDVKNKVQETYAFDKFKAIKEHVPLPKKVEAKKKNPPILHYRTKIFETNRMIYTLFFLG
jgi:hypothetical protein